MSAATPAPRRRRVGVDAAAWGNRRGFGRYVRGIVPALVRVDPATRWICFVDHPEDAAALPAGAETRLVRTRVPTAVGASAGSRRGLADLWRMRRALGDPTLDVLVFPAVYSYLPVRTRARVLVVLHDVTAEVHPRLVLAGWSSRWLWRLKTAAAIRRADALTAVSAYARRGVIERLGVAPERVSVAGEAPDPIFRPIENPRPGPALEPLEVRPGELVVLFVGGFSPHKNVPVLIESFERVAERVPAARLILVGELDSEAFESALPEIRARAAASPQAARIRFAGRLADDDLVVLLNLSAVLVLPSEMEGFGLPAVEAAAAGCAVIATRESPLPELFGEGGVWVSPRRVDELAAAIERVLTSAELRASLRETALAAARRLTWERAARELLAVVDRLSPP